MIAALKYQDALFLSACERNKKKKIWQGYTIVEIVSYLTCRELFAYLRAKGVWQEICDWVFGETLARVSSWHDL